ncbi:hypothetical protein Tco_1498955 [Tanacetum coccineum]
MSETVPHIPPPLRANPGNAGSPNRIDSIPIDNTKNTTTTNVAQNVVNEDLPQLLNSIGGVSIPQAEDNDSDVEEDTRSSSEFLADLNAKFHDRALLSN